MRVILEVKSGPDAGRKTLLGAGQVLQVGRTQWADFAIGHDGHLSGVHFALQSDGAACYVEDLKSSNGTLLNGNPVAGKMALRDGDVIQAGQTAFAVHIESDAPGESHPRILPTNAGGAASSALTAAPLATAAAMPAGKAVRYTVETCASGLTLCRGSVDEIRPGALAALLGRALPAYLIVDFNNLGAPPPEGLRADGYLFDWLDAEIAASVSPVLISHEELATWPAIVEQGWANDAVVCLFSRQDKPSLLAHLRHAIRAKPHRDDLGGGILGFCWPSIMAMLLAHNTPELVGQLLRGIDAVLVELPDLSETWQLYGSGQIDEMLGRLKFTRQAAEKAGVTQHEES